MEREANERGGYIIEAPTGHAMIVTPEAERFGEEQRRLSEQAQTRELHTSAEAETDGGEAPSGKASAARLTFRTGQARGRREHLQTPNTPEQLLVSRHTSFEQRASSTDSVRTVIHLGSEDSPVSEHYRSPTAGLNTSLQQSPSSPLQRGPETPPHPPFPGAQKVFEYPAEMQSR